MQSGMGLQNGPAHVKVYDLLAVQVGEAPCNVQCNLASPARAHTHRHCIAAARKHQLFYLVQGKCSAIMNEFAGISWDALNEI